MTAAQTAQALGLDANAIAAFTGSKEEFAQHFGVDATEAPASAAPGPDKGAVKPGDVFPAETTITASDQTNADKLAGLGYVKSGLWTTGDKMTVGTFDFYWDGTKWAAGTYP